MWMPKKQQKSIVSTDQSQPHAFGRSNLVRTIANVNHYSFHSVFVGFSLVIINRLARFLLFSFEFPPKQMRFACLPSATGATIERRIEAFDQATEIGKSCVMLVEQKKIKKKESNAVKRTTAGRTRIPLTCHFHSGFECIFSSVFIDRPCACMSTARERCKQAVKSPIANHYLANIPHLMHRFFFFFFFFFAFHFVADGVVRLNRANKQANGWMWCISFEIIIEITNLRQTSQSVSTIDRISNKKKTCNLIRKEN